MTIGIINYQVCKFPIDFPHNTWEYVNYRGPPPTVVVNKRVRAKCCPHDDHRIEGVPREAAVLLQKSRIDNHMTQRELAMALNIKVGYIEDYELGTRAPPSGIIEQINRYFRITLPRE